MSMMKLTAFLLLPVVVVGEESITRRMYDSMAQLVGEPSYPDLWWSERQTCFDSLSPGLSHTLEMAWKVILVVAYVR